MINKILILRKNFDQAIEQVLSMADLEELRIQFIGKSGRLTQIFQELKDLEKLDRINIGKDANILKAHIEEQLKTKKQVLYQSEIDKKLKRTEFFDVTIPGRDYANGTLHPITIVQSEIVSVFTGMGFKIVDGPEVEDDFYNFEALNIPKDHPARDMQDTYWLENGQLLRTHTSPCQIRAMLQYGAPLRAIAPGRCFRNEKIDPCHENTFFQLEGMMIDKNISISNLIYVMKLLVQRILNKEPVIRLRPGFFPFVEPGFELDLKCQICGGKGCPTCKNSGWLEVLPCGMIHPNVLKYGGIDSDVYTGFAFGLGLTRLTMMKYGIKDIRVLNSGELRSLKQFSVK